CKHELRSVIDARSCAPIRAAGRPQVAPRGTVESLEKGAENHGARRRALILLHALERLRLVAIHRQVLPDAIAAVIRNGRLLPGIEPFLASHALPRSEHQWPVAARGGINEYQEALNALLERRIASRIEPVADEAHHRGIVVPPFSGRQW